MKSLILSFTILVTTSTNHYIYGQNHHDNVWVLSDLNGGAYIDFPTGFPKLIPDKLPIIFEGASASISDTNGILQFYTNGCSIYNAQNLLIENGDNINPGFVNSNWCNESGGYPNAKQSTMVVPWPNKDNEYLILHQTVELHDEPVGGQISFVEKFFSTTIDMSANEGLG